MVPKKQKKLWLNTSQVRVLGETYAQHIRVMGSQTVTYTAVLVHQHHFLMRCCQDSEAIFAIQTVLHHRTHEVSV